MLQIFLETGSKKTPEYVFVDTFLKHLGVSNYVLVTVGGKDHITHFKSKFDENTLQGGRNLVLFDADAPDIGGGFAARKAELETTLFTMGVHGDLCLWPNNQDDGDFETMLDHIVRRDRHALFFDCFADYEACVAKSYNTPNRKGKFHTFITAQRSLSHTQRERVGLGDWLFDDLDLWNLDAEYLDGLKQGLGATRVNLPKSYESYTKN